MRVSAAILAVVLGTSAVLAQGDQRDNIGPIKQPAAAAKSDAKPDPKAKADTKPAKKDAAREAKKNSKPAAEAKSTETKSDAEAKTESAAKPKKTAAATNGSAAAGTPSAKPSGLQDTYAAIPRADRLAIQNDLTWGGDYTGPIDGEFSERLVAAVKAYQTRHKNTVTGVMSADERAALAAALAPRKIEVGWRLAEDPTTGARLGLPGRLTTKITALPNGTRWASEQGQLQVETFRIDTGATLEAVFEQQKKMPRRRITGSSMQADSFVVTGMQGLKKMVVRAAARDGEVRGITILYDQAMEGTMDPLVAPMSSAFVPFASGYSVAGAADAPRRKVEYGSGVIVSATGHIVTDRNLIDGCNVIAIPGLGNAERIATDTQGEIALLRVYGARNLVAAGLIGGAAPSGPGAMLVGIADPQAQGGGTAVSAVNARLGAGSSSLPLESAPALGFAGAAALDAQGRVGGMVVMKAPVVAQAGAAGAPRAAIVPVDRIRNFLEANYVAPSSGGAGAEAAKASVTRVICVRK